ncbi:MAG: hypothetical protein HYV40_00785 [Candidatus Levybacteria bacterium]|nr:hypothetical protein [Candidatus Levybacteria bacterium]
MKICYLSKLFLLATMIVSSLFPPLTHAIEDPLVLPNNKFGIHILFDSEITDAASLVNSNGGEWGYVVIPIQAGDRDLEKWQNFMNKARKLKVVPIIRLATEGDFFNTKVWRRPKEEDVLDFANFLDSLDWPVKNRYVSVFNEVNRNDEWGGRANPAEYAQLLSYTVTVFKSRSPDFYILTAGLDNASINGNGAINKITYLQRMNNAVPGIFNQVDGFVSHSYPNPSFSQPPSIQHATSIASFRFERSLLRQLTYKKLPIFITETGWSGERISDEVRGSYYTEAFETVWDDEDIVMVAPFLLRAGGGPFEIFSFVDKEGKPTKQYGSLAAMLKIQGRPTRNSTPTPTPQVLGSETGNKTLPTLSFPQDEKKKRVSVRYAAMSMFGWLFGF